MSVHAALSEGGKEMMYLICQNKYDHISTPIIKPHFYSALTNNRCGYTRALIQGLTYEFKLMRLAYEI